MLDLETLGRSSRAAIATIGACRFSVGGIVDEFYAKVDEEDCVSHGLEIETETVDWWKRQTHKANREIFGGERLPLRAALESFAKWVEEDQPVWGNGSDFDNVILTEAYKRIGMEAPWCFWNNRCYRTAMSMLPKTNVVRTGLLHHALDDACHQARCLMRGREIAESQEGRLRLGFFQL